MSTQTNNEKKLKHCSQNKLSPRLARGFSLLSAYQKATTIFVVANFILPLILQMLGATFFIYFCLIIPYAKQRRDPSSPRGGKE